MYHLWRDRLIDSSREVVLADVPREVTDGRMRFDTGQPVDLSLTSSLTVTIGAEVRGSELTDNVLTYGGWALIVSERLRNALDACGTQNVQWFPLSILDERNGRVHEGFWVGNVVGLVNCVDASKAVLDEDGIFFRRLWIDPAKAHGLNIFRLAEFEHHVLVHHSIKESIERGGFTGLAFPDANGFRDEGADPLE